MRPRALADGALRVTHVEEGSRRETVYDFDELPLPTTLKRELAEHFAGRVAPTGTWKALASSSEGWGVLVVFARWLDGQPHQIGSITDLTPALLSSWQLSRRPSTTGRRELRKTNAFLRDHPLTSPEVRTLTQRRVRPDEVKEVAYTRSEFDQIKTVAQRRFRDALHRIRANRDHLLRFRAGELDEGSHDWQVGQVLDHIATTGDVPTYLSHRRDGSLRGPRPANDLPAGFGAGASWQRLFLTSEETGALLTLLIATYGWNATPVTEMRVPDTSPNPGVDGLVIYRVSLEKRRRRGGGRHETRNLTDWGAGSPGRLIAQAIEVTTPAREVLARAGAHTDRLVVWHLNRHRDPREPTAQQFRAGFTDTGWRNLGRVWKHEHGLSVDINLRRLRKTVVAQHRREPTQHNQDTHDSVYVLPDPQTFERSVHVITDGVNDALDHARTTFAARISRDYVSPETDTATAACTDYHASPFTEPSMPCQASFLLCTACPNAVVTPRHLPRLAYLFDALNDLRGVLPPSSWRQDWQSHYSRLLDLRARPDFSTEEWATAASSLTPSEREAVQQLLTGQLDVR